MGYMQGIYTPASLNGTVQQVSGPASIGLNTGGNFSISSSNTSGPLALMALTAGLVIFYLATRKVQGSV